MPMKYEGFTVGQRIRAHDHEPRPGHGAMYAQGKIAEVLDTAAAAAKGIPYACYVVDVEHDTVFDEGRRQQILVPWETTFDYDGRVIAVEAPL